MTIRSRVAGVAGQNYGSRALIARSDATIQEMSSAELYDLMLAYYKNNGLYTDLTRALYDLAIWTEGMKPLRNPAFRVVEFYVSKLWAGVLPDAMPIITENKVIISAIEQLWAWSNWSRQKQVAARWFAIYGDLFIKAAVRVDANDVPQRVYMQLLKPQRVVGFDEDERGYLTYIRIDTPKTRRNGDGDLESYMHTEVWNKAENSFQVWEHDKEPGAKLDSLGDPKQQKAITDFDIDFIPIAHGKFRDLGEDAEDGVSRDGRGANAYIHALDKIDEANRQATRLHQMIFRYNKATEVLEGDGKDASGRPLPALRVKGSSTNSDDGTIQVGDDRMLRLPSGWRWKQTVPQLDYDAALAIVNAQMAELEKDLPELAYYRLREMGNLSGRAVRLLLSDALDRAREVRSNGEAVFIQAQEMALTIGQNAELFKGIGNYEAGDFQHHFAERDIFPISDNENSDTVSKYVQAGMPLPTALRRAGWSEEEIADLEKDIAAERKKQTDFANQMRADAALAFNGGKPE